MARENQDFIYNLAYEAASGEVKFGKDSKHAANAVFIWNSIDPKQSYAESIRKYIS